MNNTKRTGLIITAIAIIIIVGAIIWARHNPASSSRAQGELTTYVEKDFGFSIQYPSAWLMRDDLTSETCCLFIAHWTSSTSTMPATTTATTTKSAKSSQPATTTPIKTVVTEKELVKLQIGYYVRSIDDPFKAASTTAIKINGKTFYTGTTQTGQFYLLPRNNNEGVGIGLFRYTETPAEDLAAAEKAIGSITLLDKPASAAVSTSTAKTATSTPKK